MLRVSESTVIETMETKLIESFITFVALTMRRR